MIIVKLMGGLGNQMFQYAFGKNLAVKNNTELKLDTSFLLDRSPQKEHFVYRDFDLSIFNIKASFANPEEVCELTKRVNNPSMDSLLTKIFGTKKSHLKDMELHFEPEYLNWKAPVYLEGYWQSASYFQTVAQELKKVDFSFKDDLMDHSKLLLEKIRSVNAVCINIRRGDFVTNSFHGAMGVDYYKKGEEILTEKYTDAEFFIFSDDMAWCEENLTFSIPTTFVHHEYAGKKFQDYLRLMAACKHFIIPNSSFAWWAVWLSEATDPMVIAPKKWINDAHTKVSGITPENWILL